MTGRGALPPIDRAALSDGNGGLFTASHLKASIFLDKSAAARGLQHELEDFIETEANSDRPNPLKSKFTLKELDLALSNLKKKSAFGRHLFHYDMLSNLSPKNRKFLLIVFNSFPTNNCVPDNWKHAVVVPLLKPGKAPDKADSYRPIPLTSCLSKIL